MPPISPKKLQKNIKGSMPPKKRINKTFKTTKKKSTKEVKEIKEIKEIKPVKETIKGRERECNEILLFLNSPDPFLNITGNPGTGKTYTVTSLLEKIRKPYLYYNYLTDGPKIELKASKLTIIDEYDKFYKTENLKCTKLINLNTQNKIIAISNTIKPTKCNIIFKPYTKDQLKLILLDKFDFSDNSNILSYIVKKFQNFGDLRRTLSFTSDLFCRKEFEDLSLEELIFGKKDCKEFINIHHRIIFELKGEHEGETGGYERYCVRCKELGMVRMNRNDYLTILSGFE